MSIVFQVSLMSKKFFFIITMKYKVLLMMTRWSSLEWTQLITSTYFKGKYRWFSHFLFSAFFNRTKQLLELIRIISFRNRWPLHIEFFSININPINDFSFDTSNLLGIQMHIFFSSILPFLIEIWLIQYILFEKKKENFFSPSDELLQQLFLTHPSSSVVYHHFIEYLAYIQWKQRIYIELIHHHLVE